MDTEKVDASADPDEQLAESLRGFVGSVSDGRTSEGLVDGTIVKLLTEAIGDRNPIYSDPIAAEKSPHGGVVAPATMLMCWTVQARPQAWEAEDEEGRRWFRLENGLARRPSTGAEGEDAAAASGGLRGLMAEAGFVAPAVTNGWFEYKRYFKPGERLTIGPTTIEEVLGPKKTALGVGFFVTQRQQVFDAAGEEVAVVKMRMLSSRPNPRPDTPPAAEAGQPAPARPQPRSEPAPSSLWSSPAGAWAPTLESVSVGDTLPELVVELTPTQIIEGALASQDWAPVHHDRDIAQAMGHPDVFMNIQTSTGFVGRFITDWAGADAVIEALDIRLGVPNYCYDTMTMTGEVTAVEQVDGRARVTVAVQALNSIGVHISSNVTFNVGAKIGA
ncbi:MAG: MaoC family dehydratase N-terminal domain-containing protein [Acidimicrobiia bacterium]